MRCPDGSSHLETGCRSENQLQIEGSGPLVTHGWATQPRWVNIAIRPCLHSFLTHNKHHPFENKVWEIYIFIKKCIRSLLKSSLPVNDVSACKCIIVDVHVQLYYEYTPKTFKEGRVYVRDDERCERSKEVNTTELIGQMVRIRVTMLSF